MLSILVGRYASNAELELLDDDPADLWTLLNWGVFLGTSRDDVVAQMVAEFRETLADEFAIEGEVQTEPTTYGDIWHMFVQAVPLDEPASALAVQEAWFRIEERLVPPVART